MTGPADQMVYLEARVEALLKELARRDREIAAQGEVIEGLREHLAFYRGGKVNPRTIVCGSDIPAVRGKINPRTIVCGSDIRSVRAASASARVKCDVRVRG